MTAPVYRSSTGSPVSVNVQQGPDSAIRTRYLTRQPASVAAHKLPRVPGTRSSTRGLVPAAARHSPTARRLSTLTPSSVSAAVSLALHKPAPLHWCLTKTPASATVPNSPFAPPIKDSTRKIASVNVPSRPQRAVESSNLTHTHVSASVHQVEKGVLLGRYLMTTAASAFAQTHSHVQEIKSSITRFAGASVPADLHHISVHRLRFTTGHPATVSVQVNNRALPSKYTMRSAANVGVQQPEPVREHNTLTNTHASASVHDSTSATLHESLILWPARVAARVAASNQTR